MDGWHKVGDVLKCVACSAVIEHIKPPTPVEQQQASTAGVSKLESFLGAKMEAKPKIELKPDEKHFCRDCAHLISHPYLCHCSFHNKDVNPMDDCPDFKPKSPKS